MLGMYKEALDLHLLALRIRKRLGNDLDIARSLDGIGNAYDSLGRLDEATGSSPGSRQV